SSPSISAMRGRRQAVTVAADGRSAEIEGDDGLAVRLELGAGCEFSAATRAPRDEPTVETLRLHRVMTDDLEIVAPAGGEFDYRIVLPGLRPSAPRAGPPPVLALHLPRVPQPAS